MTIVSDLFDIRYGHSLELNSLTQTTPDKGVAFVSRRRGNNGIAAYVEPVPDLEPAQSGEISCALSGNGVLTTCLQERPFYTGFHVAVLRPKQALTTAQILYYCLCIRANRYRYSYGRQANKTLAKLPIPPLADIPPWIETGPVYHEMKDKVDELADTPVHAFDGPPITGDKRVKLSSLFDVVYGHNLELNALTRSSEGVNFVSRTAMNNGVSARVEPIEGLEPIEAGLLTVAGGGSVLETFLQTEPFYSGRDLYYLRPKVEMTIEQKLFFCLCIRENKFRYNYGRQANKTLRDILIPDISEIPHWVGDAYAGVLANWSKRLSAAEGIDA